MLNENSDYNGIDIKSSCFKNVFKIFELEQSSVQNKNNFSKIKLKSLLILNIVDCTNIKTIIIN
jgi:hypothetical protein